MTVRRSFVVAVLILVAIGGVALFSFATALNPFRRLPSDVSLVTRFQDHRQDLDALVATALPDSELVGVGQGLLFMGFSVYVRGTPQSDRLLTYPEVLATGRSRYLTLLRRAGLPSISRSRVGGAMRFTVLSNTDARKGFVYSKEPLTPVRASLDGLERAAGSGYLTAAYRQLAPDWYIFLEAGD